MKIHNVAVIGAGPMGRWLAGLFASAGYATVLEDILPSNLRKAAEALTATPNAVAGTIRFASSVEDAVRTADLIVDCVPDELESKLEIFSMLDRMAPPSAIFLTPTANLSIADLASCTYRADRCVAVSISRQTALPETMPLTVTSLTSPSVVDALAEFWQTVGSQVEWKMDPAEASVAEGTLF
jgi:3-hydroxybutyryl-CoA dehydrogenase